MLFKKKFGLAGIILIVLILVGMLALPKKLLPPAKETSSNQLKIGYFHGGRTMLLYRAYINNEFDKENIPLSLITKVLYQPDFYTIPKSYEDIKNIGLYGKATGGELIDEVIKGNFAGATPGEASFISAASQNLPIVAVAQLGHDVKGQAGHAIIFRKDVTISQPSDIKGKTLASRRAGDGDGVFLREFLASIGLDPQKDVKILDKVIDDELNQALKKGSIDGGYYHLMSIEKLVENDQAYVFRKLDWLNPELSQALLIFHKDFVKNHPDQVEKVIRAYMKRIKYEHGLSKEERLKDPGKGYQKGLQMEKDFQGMNLPQYDLPPKVSRELLDQMQDLLLKYKYIDKKADLSKFIDNSFVEKIYEELK